MAALALAAALVPARAQDAGRTLVGQHHAWYNYFGNHAVSKRWGLHLEGQWRRDGWGQRGMQLLLRPGIHFYLSPNTTLTAGYGFIRNSPYGPYRAAAASSEHRFWQQLLIRNRLGGVATMQHRYRLEQRNLEVLSVPAGGTPQRTGWRYENRFRYMARADFPLTRKDDRPDWYLAAYDEVMINFGRNVAANVFDQNRAYVALGRSLNASARVEAGYMNQILQQRNGRIFENNHTLMLSLFSSFRFRK